MINKLIASVLPFLPHKFVWLFSRRYIAGENMEDAVAVSEPMAEEGIRVTIDHLREYISRIEQAGDVKRIYLSMIDRFEHAGISATYSIKPTSLGMLIDFETCFSYISEIVEKAGSFNSFVRIDMEASRCVDDEIELYRRLHDVYPRNVGLVIQAYLKRTPKDMEYLATLHSKSKPVNIRLCKGIYVEPPEIAIKDRQAINARFLEALDFLFQKGIYVGIATHDRFLTGAAQKLIAKYALTRNNYEFQMLYGVTPDLRGELVAAGHRMRVYVPFGKEWFGYSTRRLNENPRMAFYIIKALFKRG
jgi:proline dehydrogenase